MQQDKYIFHLYVFSTCFRRDITHHQELQNCTHSDMVMVPREVLRDVVEEIKWRLARQYYARVGDVKRVEGSLVSRCNTVLHCDTRLLSTALHLRRMRNIDAPASILFPRRHLFGLLWEPLPYLNVYSSVTPDDG